MWNENSRLPVVGIALAALFVAACGSKEAGSPPPSTSTAAAAPPAEGQPEVKLQSFTASLSADPAKAGADATATVRVVPAGGYKVNEEYPYKCKLDAPSGTAISLAQQVIGQLDAKRKWVNHASDSKEELSIISHRIDEVPGTHTVTYRSEVDEISMTHTAHSRKGFALGAVVAAEWLKGKKGVFGMDDLLQES